MFKLPRTVFWSVALCSIPALVQSASADVTQAQGVAASCSTPVQFTQHGSGSRSGPVTLVPVLYGFSPLDSSTQAYASYLDNVYSELEESMYYGWVRMEYHAPALSHVFPAVLNAALESSPLQDGELQGVLASSISDGSLPTPANAVYVVHLPPGVVTDRMGGTTCTVNVGYNGQRFSLSYFFEYYFAVIPDAGTCGLGPDGMTRVMSHEIIENVTDPGYDGNILDGSSNGWHDTTQPSACGQEIADICNAEPTTVITPKGSVVFQKMWSNAMNACVAEDVRWHSPDHFVNPPGPFVFKPGGGVAAVSRNSAILDTFTLGNDGMLWSTGYWYGGSWHDSSPIVGAHNQFTFTPGGGVAAVSRLPTLIDTFTIGNDGKLWDAGTYGPDTNWHGAFPVVQAHNQFSFQVGGGIAAVSRNAHSLDTFAIGLDSHLWDTGWFDDVLGWHPAYEPSTNQFVFPPGGGLAAVAEDQNTIDVLTIGYDGNLWSAGQWATDHWVPAYQVFQLPEGFAQAGSQLGAVVRQPGNIVDVAIIGQDGKLWDIEGIFDNSNGFRWTNWAQLPTATTSAVFAAGGGVAVASRQISGIDVLLDTVAIGFDNIPWTAGWLAPNH
jgi:hypothetical protein